MAKCFDTYEEFWQSMSIILDDLSFDDSTVNLINRGCLAIFSPITMSPISYLETESMITNHSKVNFDDSYMKIKKNTRHTTFFGVNLPEQSNNPDHYVFQFHIQHVNVPFKFLNIYVKDTPEEYIFGARYTDKKLL